jgi:hypothetical protein
MADYSRPETVTINELKERISSADLIPSRTVLLDHFDEIYEIFTRQGIHSLLDLQKSIKNPKQMEALSKTTGIDLQYLVLLRREVESYHPKPFHLEEIDWVSSHAIKKLVENGITNSERYLARFSDKESRSSFAKQTGIDHECMDYLSNLVSLCRVQWVSPNTGRMLIEAGYDNCQKLSSADANELFAAMDQVNENGRYYKGTIGLRDIKRLIEAAKYCL